MDLGTNSEDSVALDEDFVFRAIKTWKPRILDAKGSWQRGKYLSAHL